MVMRDGSFYRYGARRGVYAMCVKVGHVGGQWWWAVGWGVGWAWGRAWRAMSCLPVRMPPHARAHVAPPRPAVPPDGTDSHQTPAPPAPSALCSSATLPHPCLAGMWCLTSTLPPSHQSHTIACPLHLLLAHITVGPE